jgi:hypothetical protein
MFTVRQVEWAVMAILFQFGDRTAMLSVSRDE